MSPKRRSAERSKLRMDEYSSSDKVLRQKGVLDTRREIDKVIKKARRDGTQSAYWTKKLLEVEEKEPDRWRHSGFKELYVNDSDGGRSSSKDSASKKRSTMYSPSAPTSPIPVRSSRRSSSNTRRNDRRSVSSDLRRGGSRPRTDKFSSSARTRTPIRSTRSPVRRSRSPIRRNRSPIRLASPTPPSRTRKSPVRRAKSPLRPTRSPGRTKSPASRHLKVDKAERRNRSVDRLSPSIRRKKSPKLPRYKSPDSRSPVKSPLMRRRSKPRSRTPPSKSNKRKMLEYRTKARRSSSSESGLSSGSPFRKKNNSKQTLSSDVLSSSDCSDSNCSMCRFEKAAKEKRAKKAIEKEKQKRAGPPPEPKLKPKAGLPRLPPPTGSSRYARSKSFTPVASSPITERRVETKHKKKSSKKEKKKTVVKASKAITTSIIHHKKIKVESPSDESESPSPKRITLSERFGKMAKWNQKKDVESHQRNIRVTAGDNYRVEELDVPLLEPFPEPAPMLLEGSWDDVRVRYAYYKDHGYLEDLSFQDYLKWEEWWYSYQEWLDTERLHSLRRRL